MRYGQIRNYDVSNGPGIRTSIFVTGCTHRCKGCFNELYMDFAYGELWTDAQTGLVLQYLQDPAISGLSVLGGEPMQNTAGLIPLLEQVRSQIKSFDKRDSDAHDPAQPTAAQKTIWLYSGYTFEEIMQDPEKVRLLSLCDVLVDGRFIEELKNLRLKFRGSENQRILDAAASLAANAAILMPGYELDPRHTITHGLAV